MSIYTSSFKPNQSQVCWRYEIVPSRRLSSYYSVSERRRLLYTLKTIESRQQQCAVHHQIDCSVVVKRRSFHLMQFVSVRPSWWYPRHDIYTYMCGAHILYRCLWSRLCSAWDALYNMASDYLWKAGRSMRYISDDQKCDVITIEHRRIVTP